MKSYVAQDVIRIKRDGRVISDQEMEWFFSEFLAGRVPDYQVTSLLMAMFLRGLNTEEMTSLTRISRDSGRFLSWPYPPETIVDKHSTGGIGDKTSLVLMPLCLLEGLKVPMISGRGLGHTGGTLDKLEAIPGMNPKPKLEVAEKIIEQCGGVFMGQTEEIARLDRHLYALRDVTATVESRPLIVASILSKKLAEGLGALVLDVKFGSGAFMESEVDARALAHDLVAVCKAFGLKSRALLTSMNQPLGHSAGNVVEVIECLEILKGEGPEDTRHLSLALAAEMVQLAYPQQDYAQIYKRLELHLQSGKAFESFKNLIALQGGDTSFLEEPQRFHRAAYKVEVGSPLTGHIRSIQTREIGQCILRLGGGRVRTSDPIDHSVGVTHIAKIGQAINKGEPLAIIETNDKVLGESLVTALRSCFDVGSVTQAETLIRDRIE